MSWAWRYGNTKTPANQRDDQGFLKYRPNPHHGRRKKMRILAVIPARYASTRLPGKPLLADTGRTLIQHVVEAARQSTRLTDIVVATDDHRIFDAVTDFGGHAVMTRTDHVSGTDRVAEAARIHSEADLVINLQGDEPEIAANSIDTLVNVMIKRPEAVMGTLATPIYDESIYRDTSCVKVVKDDGGYALYFSRSPIPYHRDGRPPEGIPWALLHLGIYAFRPRFLQQVATMPTADLEVCEKLEQLRVLENGHRIALGIVQERCVGIDTPEDYARFVARYRLANPS
jgi:3-deoxy-manno-octulosonate cytidylyltransferase (CMP-KDO synthetase)